MIFQRKEISLSKSSGLFDLFFRFRPLNNELFLFLAAKPHCDLAVIRSVAIHKNADIVTLCRFFCLAWMNQTIFEYTDELRDMDFVFKNICRRNECDEVLKLYPCDSWLFVPVPESHFDFVELWIVPIQK